MSEKIENLLYNLLASVQTKNTQTKESRAVGYAVVSKTRKSILIKMNGTKAILPVSALTEVVNGKRRFAVLLRYSVRQ